MRIVTDNHFSWNHSFMCLIYLLLNVIFKFTLDIPQQGLQIGNCISTISDTFGNYQNSLLKVSKKFKIPVNRYPYLML